MLLHRILPSRSFANAARFCSTQPVFSTSTNLSMIQRISKALAVLSSRVHPPFGVHSSKICAEGREGERSTDWRMSTTWSLQASEYLLLLNAIEGLTKAYRSHAPDELVMELPAMSLETLALCNATESAKVLNSHKAFMETFMCLLVLTAPPTISDPLPGASLSLLQESRARVFPFSRACTTNKAIKGLELEHVRIAPRREASTAYVLHSGWPSASGASEQCVQGILAGISEIRLTNDPRRANGCQPQRQSS